MTTSKKSGYTPNAVLVTAILGWLFDGFEMGLFPVVARSSLIDLLGTTSDAQIGPWVARITACFLLGAAIGGGIFGWLGDRIGRVKSLSMSILTYSVFTGLTIFVDAPWQLGLLRFLAAVGMGGEWSLGVALVRETLWGRKRTFVNGLLGAASHAGFLIVAVIALSINVTPTSWRWLMAVGATPALLVFIIRFFVPESSRWQASPRSKTPIRILLSHPHRSRLTISVALATVVHIGTWGVVYWAPAWIDQLTLGQMPQAKAMTQFAIAFGALLGGFFGAVSTKMMGQRSLYALFCASTFLTCWSVFFYLDAFTPSMLVAMSAIGFCSGTFYGWLTIYLPDLFPTAIRATGQGIAFNLGRIMAIPGVLFTGKLLQLFDGNYARAGCITAIVYLVGIVLICFAPAPSIEVQAEVSVGS